MEIKGKLGTNTHLIYTICWSLASAATCSHVVRKRKTNVLVMEAMIWWFACWLLAILLVSL